MIEVAIKKLENGLIYMDKTFFDRFTDLDLPIYGYTKVEAPSDCEVSDFNNDLTFSVEKYNERKQIEKQLRYENLVVSLIRKRYSINQELAILRQRDSKPEEYYDYNTYVEICKSEAKETLKI